MFWRKNTKNRMPCRVAGVLGVMTIGVLAVHTQAAPVPVHVSPGPGLDVQFTTDLEADVYGHKSFVGGSPAIVGGNAELGDGDSVRYISTLENGAPTLTPMSDASDWVLEFKFSQTGDAGISATMFVKNASGPNEQVILLRSVGSGATDEWEIEVGSSGGWVDLVTGLVLGDSQHTLTVHYKAGVSAMDIYLDGALQAGGNTVLDHGVYSPEFLQIQGLPGSGTVSYESVVWGQVPEPGSIALMSVGVLLMVRRRRFEV